MRKILMLVLVSLVLASSAVAKERQGWTFLKERTTSYIKAQKMCRDVAKLVRHAESEKQLFSRTVAFLVSQEDFRLDSLAAKPVVELTRFFHGYAERDRIGWWYEGIVPQATWQDRAGFADQAERMAKALPIWFDCGAVNGPGLNYVQRFANMEQSEVLAYFCNLLIFLGGKADLGLEGGPAKTLWQDWAPYRDAVISRYGLSGGCT